MKNPFKPTAGARPPILIGRSHALDSFKEGLNNGVGAPGLLTIFTGPRGVGKTVLLTEAEKAAKAAGWVVISATATPGLLVRLGARMRTNLNQLGNGPATRRITAVTAAGFGITTQLPPEHQAEWDETATELLEILNRNQTGLLITIDEIHAIDRGELTQLAASVQHMIREELPIVLLVAGLPKAVSDLLNENVSTFLRRADRIDLTDIAIPEVQDSFRETFAATNITIDDNQLEIAAKATDGYPFLIQLVGYHVWAQAVTGTVTAETLTAGIATALMRLNATVLQASLTDLSDGDKNFLKAMAQDDGPSELKDIAARMGRTTNYAGAYRKRLLDTGIITSPGYGKLDFVVPHLREYLRL